MKIEYLIQRGHFAHTQEGKEIICEIENGISEVVWPTGSSQFTVNPTRQGNGVRPIKNDFLLHLESKGWQTEVRTGIGELAPGPLDAVKTLTDGGKFAVEWETGNISSTHRAINKMALGMLRNELHGGAIILPTRTMYHYLTDRIGNYEEIAPYFDVWRTHPNLQGVLIVVAIQHDAESTEAPLIPKGTDGWSKFSAQRAKA